ncbi:cupin domain-containing protein [Streptomyces sp. NBC_01262]|uniref:cupin domain-containing protein n=1 Tax=Streptomyces sp. NBC_01262 TaxID=2903803 RepID=UPI002E325D34|nr:cupin domain-containing protein [Streptomyces sp. NBC_01262]
MPKVTSLLPALGGTRFIVLTFPPDTAMADPAFDPVAFDREQRADSPGIADLVEPDGMHTTPTVDYGIVLQGEIVLELDVGSTRHGWRNRSGQPFTMAFVLVGAEGDG